MKALLPIIFTLAGILAMGANLHSQAPAVPKSPLQILQAMKAKNQELIEKQARTLMLLEAMEKEADQIRILARRT